MTGDNRKSHRRLRPSAEPYVQRHRSEYHLPALVSGNSMMVTPEEQRAEERAALDLERRAFERRQAAFLAVTRQFYPLGNGLPAKGDLYDLDAANAEWETAKAEIDRITDEIRTGKRR